MIALPVVVSPVNEMQSTSGCSVIAEPAAFGPKPCTMLSTPGGSPASFAISPKKLAVIGRELGRLADDGVAAGQRRRELPGQQQQRQVPRADAAGHADRLAQRVVEELVVDRIAVGALVLHQLGEELEVVGRARDVEVRALADRLAGVERLELAQSSRHPRLDPGRDLHQDRRAFGDRHLRPRALVEGPARGLDREVDVGVIRLRRRCAITSPVAGLTVVERLAALRVDVLAVDEELDVEHAGARARPQYLVTRLPPLTQCGCRLRGRCPSAPWDIPAASTRTALSSTP